MGLLGSVSSKAHVSTPPSGAFCLMGLDRPLSPQWFSGPRAKEAGMWAMGRLGGEHSLNPHTVGWLGPGVRERQVPSSQPKNPEQL